jgi:pimeloyl-ACP methyl ester carboxylesterase
MSDRIREQAAMIGARKALVGILTQTAASEKDGRTGFVILNSGIIHRVGHHRMYVALARLLAGAGYPTLRFDLSGLGDSESRTDGLSLLDSAMSDIREAVDWLATTQRVGRVILVGLCSGADQALIYGISDPRVCGLVLLDPTIPQTPGYYLRYAARHLVRPRSWLEFAVDPGRAWTKMQQWRGTAPEDAWQRHRPNLNDPIIRGFLQNAYQRTMDLGIECLAVFTTGFPHQHNYRRQILDAFPTVPFNERLQLEYFVRCDHIFTAEADRRKLFGTVMNWAARITARTAVSVSTNAPSDTAPAPDAIFSYEV